MSNTPRGSPPWVVPTSTSSTPSTPRLHLYNSLTRRKDLFTPAGEVVTWYSCGPTVYDHAHMGHARSYISFDILRRVIQDYFNYPILYVQNITDIDDKIIKRARTNHLFANYKSARPSPDQVASDVVSAMQLHKERLAAAEKVDPDKYKMLMEQVNKVNVAAVTLQHIKQKTAATVAATNGLPESEQTNEDKKTGQSHEEKVLSPDLLLTASDDLISAAESVLGEWLDRELGGTVTDNSLFMELPRYFENEFNADMEKLNVLPPDVVTRVSEYVPEIVAFVQQIIDNGYAYHSNGSVYFNVAKFDAEPDHYYAKLVPEAYGNQSALQEGEGDLSVGADRLAEKQSPNDFALWKRSKPGEPAWDSPWGQGRPGWHIECSAMAGQILGSSADIHSGGVDLKFPHHDNELAQSEAHYRCPQWITYFLHTGHLHIDGCKMSKSLKNFISISDALKQHSAALLRTAFLLHAWKDTLDYSSNTMEGARQYLKMVAELGLNVADLRRRCGGASTRWGTAERSISDSFTRARAAVHAALCDSIDTRAALDAMRDLISDTNKYMNSGAEVNYQLVDNVHVYVKKMLAVFGVVLEGEAKAGGNGNSSIVLGLSQVVAEVREELRSLAREKTSEVAELQRKQLLLCDRIRDTLLPPLGVRLEDREGGAPTIKLVDPEELKKEIEAKKAAEETKRLEKEKKKEAAQAKKTQESGQQMQPPSQMYQTAEYSAWDPNTGIPTIDAEGTEITKSQGKKLVKLMEAYRKKYDKWLAQQQQA